MHVRRWLEKITLNKTKDVEEKDEERENEQKCRRRGDKTKEKTKKTNTHAHILTNGRTYSKSKMYVDHQRQRIFTFYAY